VRAGEAALSVGESSAAKVRPSARGRPVTRVQLGGRTSGLRWASGRQAEGRPSKVVCQTSGRLSLSLGAIVWGRLAGGRLERRTSRTNDNKWQANDDVDIGRTGER